METPLILRATIDQYSKKYNVDLAYIVKNELLVYLRLFVVLTTATVTSIAFARLTSREIYGQFNYIISLVAIISLFSLPGMNTSILRSTARGYEGSYRRAVRTSFAWSVAGSLVLLIGGMVYYLSDPQTGICLVLFSLFFTLIYAPNSYDAFLAGKKRFDVSTIYACLFAIVSSLAMIAVLLFLPNNLLYIVVGYVVINAALNCAFYLRSLRLIENEKEDGDCIKYGYFITTNNVIGTIAGNIDKIMIGALLGAPDLAVYSIAIAIPSSIKDLVKVAFSPITPKLCLDDISIEQVFRKIRPFLPALLVLAAISAVLYWWFIDDLILLLYGDKYIAAGFDAQILVFMILFSIPNVFLGAFVIAKKNEAAIVWGYQLFPLVRLIIMFGFTFLWGVYGALWGLNLVMAVQIIFMLIGHALTRSTNHASG
jgi:O-antigen/teichoic acid export membrane protein